MCSTGLLVFYVYFDIVTATAYVLLDGIDWLRLHDLRWISVQLKIKSKFNTKLLLVETFGQMRSKYSQSSIPLPLHKFSKGLNFIYNSKWTEL